MDKALAIERITENENLTDGLEDDDANWLLQWGTSHVSSLIAGIEDDEVAGEKVNQLMAVMRSLNAIAADRAVETPANLGEHIWALRDQYIATFGSVAPRGEDEMARLSNALPSVSAREAMRQLLAFLDAPVPRTTRAAPPPPAKPAPDARPGNSPLDSL